MTGRIKVSKRKSEAISSGVFLVALGILLYFDAWWPGILLAIWAFLATRQFLTDRAFDLVISTVVLIGIFLISAFHISWDVLGPFLFIFGGSYIIFREYFFTEDDIVIVKPKEDDFDDGKGNA